jgi:hypothetical protein
MSGVQPQQRGAHDFERGSFGLLRCAASASVQGISAGERRCRGFQK